MPVKSGDSAQSSHICERSHEQHPTPKFHTVTRCRWFHSSCKALPDTTGNCTCVKNHVHNRDLCYGRTSTRLQAIKNNELLRRVTRFSTTTNEIFFLLRSYTLVLVKKARSLFQSTVHFAAQENTHAHARTHVKFVQADDCNIVKVHCPERSAALEKWCRAPHEPREKQKEN